MNTLLTRAGALALAAAVAMPATAQVRAKAVESVRGNTSLGSVARPIERSVDLRLLGNGSADQSGSAAGDDDTGPDLPSTGTSYIWETGEQDDIVAYLSTVNQHVQSEVADDCWLKEGLFYRATTMTIRVGVTRGFAPNFELRQYADCDGRPDLSLPARLYAPTDYQFVAEGTDAWASIDLYDVTYDLDAFFPGEDIAWFSPVHIDTVDFFPEDGLDVGGFGYWVSAGKGQIQGRQAHARSPELLGSPDFVPTENELCCGICTDMAMKIEGKCCWRILEQGDAQLDASGGLFDPILSQNAPWVRSFDDFQLADPCNDGTVDYAICRIEAYVATNCDPSTIYGEIFDNLCDMPTDLENARERLTPTSVVPLDLMHTGGTTQSLPVSEIDGLPVYRVVFDCPEGIVLPDRRNYWFSVFSEQGFAAGKRTVWLFEQREICNIRLNEAKYWNPVIGYSMPTGVSDASLLAGERRGHAFRVFIREVEDRGVTTSQ